MLPEHPWSVILHFIDIVVGYPIRILVKHAVTQVLRLKFIIGIDDGLHLVVLLNYVKPLQHAVAELFVGKPGRFVLNVEHRRKVPSSSFTLLIK